MHADSSLLGKFGKNALIAAEPAGRDWPPTEVRNRHWLRSFYGWRRMAVHQRHHQQSAKDHHRAFEKPPLFQTSPIYIDIPPGGLGFSLPALQILDAHPQKCSKVAQINRVTRKRACPHIVVQLTDSW